MKTESEKWFALSILVIAQFMIVLDVSILNVALPSIERDFHLDVTALQWIVTAYTLCFGGFLLLGGRAADLFGRRRGFLSGPPLAPGPAPLAPPLPYPPPYYGGGRGGGPAEAAHE